MSQGFIKMMRTDRAMALLKDQGLFTLLAAIALRADRETGIAKLGDWREIGFKSEASYRRAKRRATRQGYATCKATNKGTLASLVSSDVYDINTPYPTSKAASYPTNKATGKAATNKKLKNINTNIKKEKQKEKIPPPLDQVVDYFLSKSGSPGMANEFFDHFDSNGWLVGGKAPMKKWTAAASNWIRRQENFNGPGKAPHRQRNRATTSQLLNDTSWADPPDQPALRDPVRDVSDIPAR